MIHLDLTIVGLDPERHHGGADMAPEPLWHWLDPQGDVADAERHPLARRLRQGRLLQSAPPPMPDAVCADDPDHLALSALLDGAAIPDAVVTASAALRWRGDRRLGAPQPAFDLSDSQSVSAFDPVHLKAETDHALVFGGRLLGLAEDEIDRLYADLDHWLSEDGLRLLRGAGDRAYLLHADGDADLLGERDLPPLACALNRNAEPLMTGDDALRPLRRWLTEVQMWLHLHPVNEDRAQSGRPTVNSFWPHGRSCAADAERALAAIEDKLPADTLVLTDSPLLLGLLPQARAWSPETDLTGLDVERVRVLLTEPAWCWLEGDEQGWLETLDAVDGWLARQLRATAEAAWTVGDGRGRRWVAPGWLDRLGRSLAGLLKRNRR